MARPLPLSSLLAVPFSGIESKAFAGGVPAPYLSDMAIRLLALVPLVFVLTGLPMALEAVPPNRFYGVRTAETLSSNEAWYVSNYWAGLVAVVLGLAATAFNLAVWKRTSASELMKVQMSLAAILLVAAAMVVAGLVSV